MSSGESLRRLRGGMVSPASLRPVGAGFTGPAAPNINNAKSRFSCWLEAARTVRNQVGTRKMKWESRSPPIRPRTPVSLPGNALGTLEVHWYARREETMTITLELPPETEASLLAQAEARGLTLEAFLKPSSPTKRRPPKPKVT